MKPIKLVKPEKKHEDAAKEYILEHRSAGEFELHGASLLEQYASDDEWLKHLDNLSRVETVPPDWVQASTFFAIRESDGRIIDH